jgi:4-amino-4-deoxy-L-arabinose transferase-like glycosyltransferase
VRERIAASWALWSVLAAQATLTLPWMWHTGPYSGEALYLSAGHSGWSHLGSYTTSFPGSPVLYPPIVGWFDSVGGLIAARLLSLIFMLGATALVYLMGDRMFGQISGLLGALLFAVCGIIVHLGAAATFDPMALFLLVLALYAAIRMRDGGIGWVLLCPFALAAANATKYNTIAWDPLIIGTVLLYGWSKKAQAICLTISVAITVFLLDLGIVMFGGSDFVTAVLQNTFYRARVGPPSSTLSVFGHAMLMTGLIVLIAIAGVWVSMVKRMPATATAFLCLLVIGALIAPILQARVHQMSSLDQNMSFGLPFAGLGAGYALGGWRKWLGRRRYWGKVIATVAAVGTVITMLIVGRAERVQFRGPSVAVAQQVATAVKNNYQPGTMILVDGNDETDRYYLPSIPEDKWIATTSAATGPSPQMYARICTGQVSIVILRITGEQFDSPTDEVIAPLLRRMFSRKTVAGKGDRKTMVYAFEGSAEDLTTCRAQINVG